VIVLLAVLRRMVSAGRGRPALPAPGPAPLAGPSRENIVILVLVGGGVLYLLGHGYAPAAALGMVAGIGVLAERVGVRLAGVRSSSADR
jgi:hypothetical protein